MDGHRIYGIRTEQQQQCWPRDDNKNVADDGKDDY